MAGPSSAPVNYRTAATALAAILMSVAAFLVGAMHSDIAENRRDLVVVQITGAAYAERLDAVEKQLKILRSIITERIEIQRADRGR